MSRLIGEWARRSIGQALVNERKADNTAPDQNHIPYFFWRRARAMHIYLGTLVIWSFYRYRTGLHHTFPSEPYAFETLACIKRFTKFTSVRVPLYTV